jgi:hypothetical protein
VFIGIETPDPASLKETLKTQNVQGDMLGSIRRLYRNGIDVLAGFIVGFDNDTLDSFETQRRFIMESGIQAAMVGLLTALPRTPLYERLRQEGRLRKDADHTDNTKLATNVIPKQMDYDEMVEAYRELYRQLQSDRGIADRIVNKLRHLAVPKYHGGYTLPESLGIVARLLARGILPGGPVRLWHFLRTFPYFAPRKIPLVVVEWLTGLTMQDYVRRHFGHGHSRRNADSEQALLAAARARIVPYLGDDSVAVSSVLDVTPQLSLSLRGVVEWRLLSRVAGQLQRLMQNTPAVLTLRLEAPWHIEQQALDTLLGGLKRYGDRVFVLVDERVRHLVTVDSSVFQLVLGEPE